MTNLEKAWNSFPEAQRRSVATAFGEAFCNTHDCDGCPRREICWDKTRPDVGLVWANEIMAWAMKEADDA